MESLHAEVDLWPCNWTFKALLHAMIDVGLVVDLTCQFPDCRYPGEDFDFSPGDRRGRKRGPVLDHIIPQRAGGPHRIQNLRLAHLGCNSIWRKNQKGSYLTNESKAVIAERARAQWATGRGRTHTPEQRVQMSEKMKNRQITWEVNRGKKQSDASKRGWETRRKRMTSE